VTGPGCSPTFRYETRITTDFADPWSRTPPAPAMRQAGEALRMIRSGQRFSVYGLNAPIAE
jgi:hypothetical protein